MRYYLQLHQSQPRHMRSTCTTGYLHSHTHRIGNQMFSTSVTRTRHLSPISHFKGNSDLLRDGGTATRAGFGLINKRKGWKVKYYKVYI